MPQRLFRLSDLLAHKYNIVVTGADKLINYDKIKDKNIKTLYKHIIILEKLLFEAQDFRKLTRSAEDPYITFSEESKNTINNCLTIESAINFLSNHTDLSLEDLAVPILDIQKALLSVLNSEMGKGTEDRWGLSREKYLPILKALSEVKTTMGAYHDPTKMDALSKRDLDREFGRITNFLNSVGSHLDEILDILKRSGVHGMIDEIKKEKAVEKAPPIGDTSRVPATAADHELRQIMRTFPDQLGLTTLGLNPDNIITWKKYLPDSEGGQPLSSTLGRVIYHALGASARYYPGMDVPPGSIVVNWMVQGMPRPKIIGQSILKNLNILRNRLVNQYNVLKIKEQKNTERLFGSPAPLETKPQSPPPISTNVDEDIREAVLGFNDRERAIWNKIPKDIKDRIYRGQYDLDEAMKDYENM